MSVHYDSTFNYLGIVRGGQTNVSMYAYTFSLQTITYIQPRNRLYSVKYITIWRDIPFMW